MPERANHGDGGGDEAARMDRQVRGLIEAVPAAHRALFERLHRLIVGTHPEVTVGLSYRMPTYRVGDRRLYVGAWKHGISIYGWRQDDDGGFVAAHPGLKTSTGTIRLRPEDAAGIADGETPHAFAGRAESAAPSLTARR